MVGMDRMGGLWRGGKYICVIYVAKLDRLNMGKLEVCKESTAGL